MENICYLLSSWKCSSVQRNSLLLCSLIWSSDCQSNRSLQIWYAQLVFRVMIPRGVFSRSAWAVHRRHSFITLVFWYLDEICALCCGLLNRSSKNLACLSQEPWLHRGWDAHRKAPMGGIWGHGSDIQDRHPADQSAAAAARLWPGSGLYPLHLRGGQTQAECRGAAQASFLTDTVLSVKCTDPLSPLIYFRGDPSLTEALKTECFSFQRQRVLLQEFPQGGTKYFLMRLLIPTQNSFQRKHYQVTVRAPVVTLPVYIYVFCSYKQMLGIHRLSDTQT